MRIRLPRLCTTLFAALAAAVLAAGLAVAPARAAIEVNVNRGDVQPLPIAVPAFAGSQGADIAGVIAANLQRSGLFRPLDPASFTEHDLNVAVQPNFAAWKPINAQALITPAMSVPTWPPAKGGIAMGRGWTSPRLTLTSMSARAGRATSPAAGRAASAISRVRLEKGVIRSRPLAR